MKKIFIQTEDNTIEHVVKNMLEREYQFEIVGKDNGIHIYFNKGVWSLIDRGNTVSISDSPRVLCLDETDPSLAELFIQARIDFYSETLNVTTPWRTIPASAIYDFIKFRLAIESHDVHIFVSKSGRIKE